MVTLIPFRRVSQHTFPLPLVNESSCHQLWGRSSLISHSSWLHHNEVSIVRVIVFSLCGKDTV
jgi:hypothetical protein